MSALLLSSWLLSFARLCLHAADAAETISCLLPTWAGVTLYVVVTSAPLCRIMAPTEQYFDSESSIASFTDWSSMSLPEIA